MVRGVTDFNPISAATSERVAPLLLLAFLVAGGVFSSSPSPSRTETDAAEDGEVKICLKDCHNGTSGRFVFED